MLVKDSWTRTRAVYIGINGRIAFGENDGKYHTMVEIMVLTVAWRRQYAERLSLHGIVIENVQYMSAVNLSGAHHGISHCKTLTTVTVVLTMIIWMQSSAY